MYLAQAHDMGHSMRYRHLDHHGMVWVGWDSSEGEEARRKDHEVDLE